MDAREEFFAKHKDTLQTIEARRRLENDPDLLQDMTFKREGDRLVLTFRIRGMTGEFDIHQVAIKGDDTDETRQAVRNAAQFYAASLAYDNGARAA